MQVTLKKASDLSRAAIEMANAVKPRSVLQLSIYSPKPVAEVLEAAQTDLAQAMADIENLLTVGYLVRDIIAEANDEVGVNVMLTQIACQDALEKRLRPLLESDHGAETDPVAVQAEIDASKSNENRYMSSSVSMGVIDAPLMESIRARVITIKRTKADLNDEVTALNLNTLVTLTDPIVAMLQTYKILD